VPQQKIVGKKEIPAFQKMAKLPSRDSSLYEISELKIQGTEEFG